MKRSALLANWSVTVLLLQACSATGTGQEYTLYRNAVSDPAMRIHVATFDASDGDEYNQENCLVAQVLFQAQDGISTRFWCEKGRFHK